MSTRSEVYIQREDGSIYGCYCHCDGYPSHRGLECLAHSEAGTLIDFINENREAEIYEEDEYDEYDWHSEEVMLHHITYSDISWAYVWHLDGGWKVWRQTWNGKQFGVENAGDIWNLVAQESDITENELRERVSALAKIYSREYGKDVSIPYSIHIVKLSVIDNHPKVEQSDNPQESFEKAQ